MLKYKNIYLFITYTYYCDYHSWEFVNSPLNFAASLYRFLTLECSKYRNSLTSTSIYVFFLFDVITLYILFFSFNFFFFFNEFHLYVTLLNKKKYLETRAKDFVQNRILYSKGCLYEHLTERI